MDRSSFVVGFGRKRCHDDTRGAQRFAERKMRIDASKQITRSLLSYLSVLTGVIGVNLRLFFLALENEFLFSQLLSRGVRRHAAATNVMRETDPFQMKK